MSFCSGIALKPQAGVCAVLLIVLMAGCAARKPASAPPPTLTSTASTNNWAKVGPLFKAVNMTAVGAVFWVCGDNEMIASSFDGGNSWNLRHENAGGATLLNIVFVTGKVGHAAGTKGLLLSTTDGGKTWNAHRAEDVVWAFPFPMRATASL